MIKKFILVFMIFALIFNAQIRTANAVFFVPSAIAWAVGAGASTVMQTQIRNAAIGTVIAGVGWYAANTPATNSQKKDYPAYVPFNPLDPLDPPAGWNPATPAETAAGVVLPHPPVVESISLGYGSLYAGLCPSGYLNPAALAICIQQGLTGIGYQQVSCSTYSVTNLICTKWVGYTDTTYPVIVRTAPYVCPPGYKPNSNNTLCNLFSEVSVDYPVTNTPPLSFVFDGLKNGTCEITRTGNTYQSNSRDPDCASGSASMAAAANGGSVVVQPNNVTSISEDGKKVEVKMNPDGSQTVTTFIPNLVTNTTDVETFNLSAPNALSGEVKLTGVSSNSIPGIGTAANPATPNQKVDVVFPSDYARTGEAVDAAGMLVRPLNNISDALTTPALLTPEPTVNNADLPVFGTIFDDIKGWQFPAHSSTCTAQSLVLFGKTYSFDAICHYLQPHYNTIHSAMMFTFSVLALFVVLGA